MKKDLTLYGETCPTWDTNDCAVRALAVATGATYAQASLFFNATGRQLKKGTPYSSVELVCEEWLGMKPIKSAEEMPLGLFAAAAVGRFMVLKRGHAFAVIDGVVHDWETSTKESTVVVKAWMVTPVTLARIKAAARLQEGV